MKGADDQQLVVVIAFLDKNYLRSVSFPKGAFFAATPSACRHWFRVFTTWLLGWTYRHDEGDHDGFLLALNFHLRNVVWLDDSTPWR